MIKLLEKIVMILSICGLLNSCVDDTFQKNEEVVVDGIPVKACLSYSATDAKKVTKATDGEEEAINDIFVILFSESGKYSGSQFIDIAGTASQKKINIETTSGSKRVYAVANLKSSSFTNSDGTHILVRKVQEFLAQSDEQKTLDNWLNVSADMTQEQVTWGTGSFLMSGRFVATNDDKGDGKCIFNITGSLVNAGEIKFDRSVASISFNISAAEGVTFTPTSWSVRNVPKSVYLYQKGSNPAEASYFHTTPTQVSNNKFNFYMLENRGKVQNKDRFLQAIEGKNDHEIADIRETYDKSEGEPATENDKKYTYAPQAGTYVVLKGSFSGKANNPFTDKESHATAEVTYFIHLGYAQEDTRAADFEIMRNYKYTYNVKVLGVNKIIVEAMREGETYRADGDVVFTDAEVLDVDAHYSRVKLTFNKGEELGDFLCQVSTAATGFKAENVTTNTDIDWVHFIQTTDADAERPNFTTTGNGPSKGLMNIKGLADKFKNGKVVYDVNGEASFYAYIKENYYDAGVSLDKFINYDATTGASKTRVMTIALRKGNNGHSSVSSARYIIRQKPIISIFNMDDSRVQGATTWGVEWLSENEGDNYPQMSLKNKAANGLEYGVGSASSSTDGFGNMKAELRAQSVAWNSSDIINKAYAACMSRNRDENGDGNIDDSEIKWYLPAINQYQHLWVGMNAVPDDATLYPKEFRNVSAWWLYHYYSNTDKSIFWAEEGSAFTNGGNDQSNNSKKHIRCARNIGSGDTLAIASKGSTTSTVNGLTVSKIAIDYRLAPSALRGEQYNDGQLLLHNEYSEQNKVFENFLVSNVLYAVDENGRETDANQTWQSLADGLGIEIEDGNGGTNICEKKLGGGWRAPNQRELILLTSVGGYTDNMFSATYFSMYYDQENGSLIKESSPHPGWKGPRIGYRYIGTIQLVTPPYGDKKGDDGASLKIRCVKDSK